MAISLVKPHIVRALFGDDTIEREAPDSPPKSDVLLRSWINKVAENVKNGIDGVLAWESLSRTITYIKGPSKNLPEIVSLIEQVNVVAQSRLISSEELEISLKKAIDVIKKSEEEKLLTYS